MSNTKQVVEELQAVLPMIPEFRKEFAGSLIQNYYKYQHLSDKQVYWAEKMIREAISPPEQHTVNAGEFCKVYELMHRAQGNGLKWPKLRLQVVDPAQSDSYLPVVFGISGPNSKRPGTIHLTDGGPYGDNVFYGWITEQGIWEVGHKVEEAVEQKIKDLLKILSADPIHTLMDYGQVTGNCSCCGSGLSHENSVAMGLGPVCAAKWGLKEEWKKAAKEKGVLNA
jgi:hypothetical protein